MDPEDDGDDTRYLDEMTPLLDVVLEHVPKAVNQSEGGSAEILRAQPFNLAYDNYVGRMAVSRIYSGSLFVGQQVIIKKPLTEDGKGGEDLPCRLALRESCLAKRSEKQCGRVEATVRIIVSPPGR